MIKKEIRVLGLSFTDPSLKGPAPIQVVGVVYRGNRWLEGVMRTTLPPEVTNLTPSIVKMVTRSPHFPQLRVLAIDRLVSRSGRFVDIRALGRNTRLPVLAVLRRRIPASALRKRLRGSSRQTLNAFAKLPCMEWKAAKRFHVYYVGLGEMDPERLLEVCTSREGVPEATRVAGLACSSLQKVLIAHFPRPLRV